MHNIFMTISELYNLLYLAEGSLDRLFNMWISGTFAVVLACYFAAERMGRFMYLFVSLLYIFFTTIVAIRWLENGQRYIVFNDQLIAQGEVIESSTSAIMPFLTVSTFLGGTIGALYFAWHSYKNHGQGT